MGHQLAGVKLPGSTARDVAGHVLSGALPVTELGCVEGRRNFRVGQNAAADVVVVTATAAIVVTTLKLPFNLIVLKKAEPN